MQYLAQQLFADQLTNALSALKPTDIVLRPPDKYFGGYEGFGVSSATNIVITLSQGSLANFRPAFQQMAQGPGGQFTITLSAPTVTVDYNWNEQYLYHDGENNYSENRDNNYPFTIIIDAVQVTIPITLTQQADSYTLKVGAANVTLTGVRPNVPGGSVTWDWDWGWSVDTTTMNGLTNMDFRTPVQNLLQSLLGTIPASGHLTSNTIFNFNEGDTPLDFPNNQAIRLGVTGNVTWEGLGFTGGTPPSLPVPDVPTDNHVHFFASDYEFNELYWAFWKDGRLNRTITAADFPADPGILNTAHWKTDLPALFEKYPGLNMTVDVTPQAPPTLIFQAVYDLTYGDNGVLTTQEAALPTDLYEKLATLRGSVYLTPEAYSAALQAALPQIDPQLVQQIMQASLVNGPFSQVYQVTAAGLTTLQSQLPSGIYSALSAALVVGQVFVDKAWLLVAVENALGTLR